MPKCATLSPATARRNSTEGDFGSSVSWDTPPNMNRVMALTFRPAALATRLWANSWASTETKKRMLVAKPITQQVAVLQSW
jgi:hypothetical protein